ncbi:hypothetical protein HJ01_02859 [Flavobacterium frigoris PS1]|uniref:Uncharacterized protein n=1 Tax=Flavobacterium frigoris (strain PS1) TaxID=1086011 RepID=H7FU67_FLAFP|nr:hypothetical protein HJ01_02859 [Flavobacterium frigoris PS1]
MLKKQKVLKKKSQNHIKMILRFFFQNEIYYTNGTSFALNIS